MFIYLYILEVYIICIILLYYIHIVYTYIYLGINFYYFIKLNCFLFCYYVTDEVASDSCCRLDVRVPIIITTRYE